MQYLPKRAITLTLGAVLALVAVGCGDGTGAPAASSFSFQQGYESGWRSQGQRAAGASRQGRSDVCTTFRAGQTRAALAYGNPQRVADWSNEDWVDGCITGWNDRNGNRPALYP